MIKNIPQHILEAINCGEVAAENYYSAYGKENLEFALAQLRLSDKEILAEYPAEKMFEKMQGEQKGPAAAKRPVLGMGMWSRVAGVAAAVVVLFVAVANNSKLNLSAPNAQIATEEGYRLKGAAKGEPKLFIYRQKKSSAELLSSNSKGFENDVLQVAFNASGAGFGVIFSVDGNGNVTNHYPEKSLKSAMLDPAAGTTYLDYSYQLDDAPNYEVFVMVTADKEFDLSQADLNFENKSLKYILKGTYLPQDLQFTTFTIKK